jgi:hypothetical protein
MSLVKKMTTGWMFAAVAAVALVPGASKAQDAATTTAAPASTASAQVAAPAQAGGTRVHGTIVDPDGELIPGAKVTLTPTKGAAAKQTVSGSDGTYSINVPSGTYTLVVTMPGFSTYSALNVKVQAVAGQTFDVKMAVGQDVVVNVDDTAAQLSVDPDNNASSTVLTGAALDALSDDPDDLQSELEALAGPASGPNGAQFYIDGFTGGQLPPKQSIREIRINQNPFSAQYDKPGFGRVEIFTKPGSDQYHGSFQTNANTKVLNTGSPIVTSGVPQPDYYTLLFNGQISGPINKNASFTFGGQYRSIHNNTIIDPEDLYTLTASPGTPCPPGTTAGCETLVFPNGYVSSVAAPQTRYDFSPRVDLALGKKNTMTVRYRVEHNTLNNQGIGGNQLANNAYTATQGEQDVQISDTQTVTQKIINEVHFEWQRSTTGDTPLNTTPQLSVAGGFITGGDASTGTTNDVQNHFEYQNYTSIALAHNFIRLGGRVRQTFETNTTNAGANGSFSFLSTPTATALQNYINGTPTQFSVTTYAQPKVSAQTTDAGLYAEDDWKPKSNVTLSYGVRYETQNFISDHSDFAPRVALSYGLGKKKSGGPLVVVRGGFGLFYDRLSLGNQLNTVQENGVNQIPSLVSNPTLSATCSATTANAQTGCGASATTGHVTTQSVQSSSNFDKNYRSPYQEQTNLGADIQPFKFATMSFNYQHVVGVHQLVNDNLNAQADATNPSAPIKNVYLTEGYFRQNQFITNFNYRGSAKWSLGGFYAVNFGTNSDVTGSPTNPYNIGADYGRAGFAVRSRTFLFGSFNFPHLITVSPLLAAQSGNPVNITTGEDNFGYLTNNTRPIFATPGTAGAKTFAGCGTFVDPGLYPGNPNGYKEIPVNYCTGPANFTLNARISKTIGFGKKIGAAVPDQGPGGQQGGGPPGGPGGGRGGRGGGGGGFGGPGGGGRGGGASSGKKYNLVLAVQLQNLFNVVDRASPNGTLSSPSFGQLTNLATQIYTSNDAVRRVQLSASFNF